MLFFSIFSTSNDKNPFPSNMLNLKKFSTKIQWAVINNCSWIVKKQRRFFIPPTDLFFICLSFLSHYFLPSSFFSVSWFGVVWWSNGCRWWWRWFDSRWLWSDGHRSWVRQSNGRGGGLVWVVGVTDLLGLRVCDRFWFTDLVLLPVGFGSPIC